MLANEASGLDYYRQFYCHHTLTGHQGSIYAITVSQQRPIAWSWGLDEKLYRWNLETGERQLALENLKGIQHLCVTPDEQKIIGCSWDTPTQIWDLNTGELLHQLYPSCPETLSRASSPELQDIANSIAVHPSGQWLATGGWDQQIRLWDIESGQCLASWAGHSGDINAVIFAEEGNYLLSASWDCTIRCWDLSLGDCVKVIKSQSQPFEKIVITPEGQEVIATSKRKTLTFWPLNKNRCRKTVRGHSKEIVALMMTPDGETVITASWDETIRFWDRLTGDCFHTCHEHEGRIWAAALTPDGQYLVTGGQDQQLRVWRSKTGGNIEK